METHIYTGHVREHLSTLTQVVLDTILMVLARRLNIFVLLHTHPPH